MRESTSVAAAAASLALVLAWQGGWSCRCALLHSTVCELARVSEAARLAAGVLPQTAQLLAHAIGHGDGVELRRQCTADVSCTMLQLSVRIVLRAQLVLDGPASSRMCDSHVSKGTLLPAPTAAYVNAFDTLRMRM